MVIRMTKNDWTGLEGLLCDDNEAIVTIIGNQLVNYFPNYSIGAPCTVQKLQKFI